MIRNTFMILLVLAAMFSATAASANGGRAFDTVVNDEVDIYVNVDDVETLAFDNSFAETSIGVIDDGSKIDAPVTIDVYAKDVFTKARNWSEACTAIGVIGGCEDEASWMKK